ncbi:hypothetical protein HELRODRAFT_86567, partial [Helobdella robusta]|uniref:Dynein heavy chain tail domain-containing protein n=1 Tax=Helobdella robusta TaxID=6412 RepID=T1G6D9_HELRO
LYHGDPPSMIKSLHSLMNAIRTIFTISRYYNSSEKATGLLLKITNQMLIACKVHLTNHGRERVWEQSRKEVICKIADCVNLKDAFREAYKYTKDKMARVPGGDIYILPTFVSVKKCF